MTDTPMPISTSLSNLSLFNHLVGDSKQRRRDNEAQGLSGLAINHKLKLRWLLNWQISRVRALENFIDIVRCMPVFLRQAWRITYKTT